MHDLIVSTVDNPIIALEVEKVLEAMADKAKYEFELYSYLAKGLDDATLLNLAKERYQNTIDLIDRLRKSDRVSARLDYSDPLFYPPGCGELIRIGIQANYAKRMAVDGWTIEKVAQASIAELKKYDFSPANCGDYFPEYWRKMAKLRLTKENQA